ncbi:MAG: ABC transporter ATP-binding protein [Gemmatimonadota bacterium]
MNADEVTVAYDPVVRLSGLTRRFGPLTAVDGLALEVRRGELFGIVGPDGAGKTTTLRMLAGVLPPSGGRAEVLGVDVGTDPEGAKPRVAYMAQRFGLYGDLTVAENLRFYADLYRVPRAARPERLERLYRFSNLGPFTDRLAANLSGGMKQKLALSCALIHEPELLLLDEPTFGVDPISRRELWAILREMNERGVTIVLTTSYLDEAERCHRVAMLHQGRILDLDTPARLQATMHGSLLAVRARPARAARDALRAAPGVRRASLFGQAVHVVVDEAADGEALVRAALGSMEVDGVEVIRPSLEDVFIERVGADV